MGSTSTKGHRLQECRIIRLAVGKMDLHGNLKGTIELDRSNGTEFKIVFEP